MTRLGGTRVHIRPLPVFAGLLVLSGAFLAWRHFGQSAAPAAPPPPPVPVTAARAKQDTIPVYLRGIGSIQALNAVEIHPQVGGIITQIPVTEGQEVHKGDILALIDPRPLQAALDKANAQKTQDQAQLANAVADQQRYATLARSEFASRQQLETQQSTVAKLQGSIQSDDASIDDAKINLDYAVVRSPLDGRIGLRRVDPGNLIQANATGPGILYVTQVRPISVVFTLPQSDLDRVKTAMAKAALPVLATADGVPGPAHGVLQTPDNAINPGTGTIQFKALFPNTDERLTPGGFVTTQLQVGTATGVTIPHEAVQHSQDALFVFAIKADKTVERRDIKVQYDDGQNTVLQDGVKDGEQVVVAGQSRIGPGTKVSFGKPDAPPDGKPDDNSNQSASR